MYNITPALALAWDELLHTVVPAFDRNLGMALMELRQTERARPMT